MCKINILDRPQMMIIGFTSQQEGLYWLKQCGERISVLKEVCKDIDTESPYKFLLRVSAPNIEERVCFAKKRNIHESKILTSKEWMSLTKTDTFELLFPCYKFTEGQNCLCKRCEGNHGDKLKFLSETIKQGRGVAIPVLMNMN